MDKSLGVSVGVSVGVAVGASVEFSVGERGLPWYALGTGVDHDVDLAVDLAVKIAVEIAMTRAMDLHMVGLHGVPLLAVECPWKPVECP